MQGMLDALLPGAVTVVLERTADENRLSSALNRGKRTIGIRVPDSDFIRQVCRAFGSAIALTRSVLRIPSGAPFAGCIGGAPLRAVLWESASFAFSLSPLPALSLLSPSPLPTLSSLLFSPLSSLLPPPPLPPLSSLPPLTHHAPPRSANLSGRTSSLQVGEFEVMWDRLAVVFDGGAIPGGRAGSTIVDLSEPGRYSILRAGEVQGRVEGVMKRFGWERSLE